MVSDGYAKNPLAKFWRENKMKQTAVVKELRFVQIPTGSCFYAIPSISNLSFGDYLPIAEQIEALGDRANLSSVELTVGKTQDEVGTSYETPETDPLLALAGTLKWDDISGPDTVSLPEIRVVKGAHEDNPDPLLALAGTLQSDVSDISERHDDYIAAALLAEFRGDEDE